jgi:NADPH:quinone reductase-like Zn-dependent oxidoreductase
MHRLLSLGADEVIAFEDDGKPAEAALRKHFEQGVDIVLDYLWGPSADRTITAAASQKITSPIRFIQIGAVSEPNITLAATVLRSSAIQIMGSGIGSVAFEDIMRVLSKLLQAAPGAGFKIATRALPLDRLGEVWSLESHTPRIVFSMRA